MKSKLLLLILSIATVATMLFSCEFPFLPPPPADDAEYSRVVYSDADLDLLDVRSALEDIIGIVSVTPDSEAAIDGEIVFGDTNRQVTALAKAALEKELNKTSDYDIGYIVYSDGKNIAVYWNAAGMEEIAIPKFISEFLSDDTIEINKGVAFTDFYNLGNFEREKAWAVIEASADPEVYAALRELSMFYEGDKIAEWIANLYDPDIGGFYYSISARDNEPFRPDIESTAQALGIMGSGGGGFNRNTDLPEDIKAAIVKFAKGLQSREDGYFYHPQWPQGKENLDTDRYGRDVDSATGVITSFTLDTDGDGVQEKQYPNYCILSTKCEKHYGTDERCIFPISSVESVTALTISDSRNITDVVGVGVSAAVSKVTGTAKSSVVAVAVSDHPDYSSREAFRTWLYAYNTEEKLRESSGYAHNLAALHSEIVSHGMQDIVLDQLDAFQSMLFEEQQASEQTPSGCWQEQPDYQAVWGMFKYITTFYNDAATGRQVNPECIPYMIRTAIAVIKSPLPSDKHMNDVMNQWTCISNIIDNAKKYNPQVVDEIFAIINEDAVGIIDCTIDKITPFKCPDGSIGYSTTGKSLTSIYGVQISLGFVEGDPNAVNLCMSLYSTIFKCMGYTRVPIMCRADVELFIDAITTLEPITKTERHVETIDFEGGQPDGMNWTPGDNGGSVEITSDPTDSSNSVLLIDSPVGSQTSDRVKFSPIQIGSGCAIFETDIYVEKCESNNYMMQIYIGRIFMITLNKSGNNVSIRVTPDDGNGNLHYNIATVPMGEWFTLRVECYSASMIDEDGAKAKAKIFVNGEYVTTSENYMYSNRGNNPNTAYTGVEFYSMRSSNNKIYFDNCYFASEVKPYDEDNHEIADARDSDSN